MSYSRWSNSTWYTFWTSTSPKGFLAKKQQVFEICDFPSYFVTYQEIVDDVDDVIAKVKEFYNQPHENPMLLGWDKETGKPIYDEPVSMEAKNPTDEELEELKGYMLNFVKDIDHFYTPWTYFKYAVYYHYRSKLHRTYRKLFSNNEQQ